MASVAGVDGVELPQSTRMVDAARFVSAAEPILGWEEGAFARDLAEMRAGSRESVVEASPLTAPLVALTNAGGWEGTAEELLTALELRVDERSRNRPDWPRTPRGLSGQLRRLAPELRLRAGDDAKIDIIFDQKEPHTRRRLVSIQQVPGTTVPTVPTVPGSTIQADGTPRAAPATVPDRPPQAGAAPGDGGDGGGRFRNRQPSPESEREWHPGDGGDGRFPLFLGEERQDDAEPWHCPTDRGSGHVQGTRLDGSTFCATCYGPLSASDPAAGDEIEGGQL